MSADGDPRPSGSATPGDAEKPAGARGDSEVNAAEPTDRPQGAEAPGVGSTAAAAAPATGDSGSAPPAGRPAAGDTGSAGAARPGPADWGDTELPPSTGAGPPAAAGRHPVAALALLAVGAAALWGASRLTWVTVTSADGLTEPRTDELNGSTWFGALTPLALALLAAIAAVLATRGWLRRLVGVLVALIAAVTAVPALALVTGSGATEQRAAELADLPGRAQVQDLATAASPAVLTLFGALAAFAAGLLLTRMPTATKQLSGKYDNPATRKAAATQAVQSASGEPLPERVLWDALDAGADPTDAATGSVSATEVSETPAEPDGAAGQAPASGAPVREEPTESGGTGKPGSVAPGDNP